MLDLTPPADPDLIEMSLPVMRVSQPVGDMYIASMSHKTITKISHFDVRRIAKESREIETYLGIQRPLDLKRVDQIREYVTYPDASFPSSVIISIDYEYASYDEEGHILVVRNYRIGEDRPSINIGNVARVLDGQHRIAGLEKYGNEKFDVIVTIFVGADISDQAYIFATVNLEQKKVSKSLAYDLFALAKSRSPQKTAHNIAVTFDQDKSGPFYKKIKRLGIATPGRDAETISQATFIDGIMNYISVNPKLDRSILLRGKSLPIPSNQELRKVIFRKFFVAEDDLSMARTIHEFFSAIRDKWPIAWDADGLGYMLNRTNGYRACARFLRPAYLYYTIGKEVVTRTQFGSLLERSSLRDEDFTTDNFPPGTSGEAALFNRLVLDCDLDRIS